MTCSSVSALATSTGVSDATAPPETLKRRGRQQERLDVETAVLEKAADDEAAFGDEEAVGAQPGGITDVRVVLEPGIVRTVDRRGHVSTRAAYSRTTDRRLRCWSMTCWPRRLLRNTFDSPFIIGCGTKRITSNCSWASAVRIS